MKSTSSARKGQGVRKYQEIDEVVSDMSGRFLMENEKDHLPKLAFQVPGAAVELAGDYDLDRDNLDFLGTLKLQARVSETHDRVETLGAKARRSVLCEERRRNVPPYRCRRPSRQPKFGLARSRNK